MKGLVSCLVKLNYKIVSILLLAILTNCVELHEFDVQNKNTTLVIEGFISDKSFNNTLDYPSEGRFFSVKLKWSNRVTNQHDQVVVGASINLVDSEDIVINYLESIESPGTYFIRDPDFFSISGRAYRMQILLKNGDVYESDWEKMVNESILPMRDICFEELEKKVYRWEFDEFDINTEQGINILLELPANDNGTPIYYRWDFTPTWIYIAPLSSIKDINHKCWVTSNEYLNSYTLEEDLEGGYDCTIIYMSLYRNERIFDKLSILINQKVLTAGYYRFWKEMKEQTQRGGLFDAPPYNLYSNFKQVGGDNKYVSGYFGVVKEQAKRWYLTNKDLSYSYYFGDYLREECIYYGDPPARVCYNCLLYTNGEATLIKPNWWED